MLGMATVHRLEVMEHATDKLMESWSNARGDVLLVRRIGESDWMAFIDHVAVTDAERLNGPMAYADEGQGEQDARMRAPGAGALARLLALQEHMHLVFAP